VSLSPELKGIPGAQQLHDWFGYWPDFHDAEVIEVNLRRSGESSFKIHTWQMTDRADEKGFYLSTKHVIVEFLLENILGMEIEGFNHQNVISSLGLRLTPNGYIVDFGPCLRLGGNNRSQDDYFTHYAWKTGLNTLAVKLIYSSCVPLLHLLPS
jgi:hypothetical protein